MGSRRGCVLAACGPHRRTEGCHLSPTGERRSQPPLLMPVGCLVCVGGQWEVQGRQGGGGEGKCREVCGG